MKIVELHLIGGAGVGAWYFGDEPAPPAGVAPVVDYRRLRVPDEYHRLTLSGVIEVCEIPDRTGRRCLLTASELIDMASISHDPTDPVRFAEEAS